MKIRTFKNVAQQGDVLLKRVAKIPAGAKKVDAVGGRFIIAAGETTGHCHAVEETADVELVEVNGTLYIKAAKDTVLTHEEHGAVKIPEGTFQVGRVAEYDHFLEEARQVMD